MEIFIFFFIYNKSNLILNHFIIVMLHFSRKKLLWEMRQIRKDFPLLFLSSCRGLARRFFSSHFFNIVLRKPYVLRCIELI